MNPYQLKTNMSNPFRASKKNCAFMTIIFVLALLGNNIFDKKILALMIVLILCFNPRRLLVALNNLWKFIPIIAMVIWCFVTMAWSPHPFKTLDGATVQAALVFACILSAYTSDPKEWYKPIRNAVLIVLFLNCLFIIAFPGSATSNAGMTGLYFHKNNFGLVCALIVIVLATTPNKRMLDYSGILIAGVLLTLSQSKTSIGFTALTLVILLIKNRFIGKNPTPMSAERYSYLFAHTWIIFAVLSTLLIVFRQELLDLVYNQLDSEAFTGRGRLWIAMFEFVQSNILAGVGYSSVWGLDESSLVYLTEVGKNAPLWAEQLSASDGGYVDLVIALGIVGLLLYIAIAIQMSIKLFSINNHNLLFAILVFFTLHNLMETTVLLSSNSLWFVFLYCMSIVNAKFITRHANE